jgi:hypothetical protein
MQLPMGDIHDKCKKKAKSLHPTLQLVGEFWKNKVSAMQAETIGTIYCFADNIIGAALHPALFRRSGVKSQHL